MRVTDLKFPESDIPAIAARYVLGLSPKDKLLETEIEGFRVVVQSSGYLTKDQLRKLAKWKSRRSAGWIDDNEDDFIQEITAFALSAKDERARIESLTLLDGVEWAMASVILHFCHKDPYPILDFRALESLSTKQPRSYNFKFWEEYKSVTRDLAKRAGVDMRTLDRAMWKYDEEDQKAS